MRKYQKGSPPPPDLFFGFYPNKSGFTLIELLVVIAVIGVLATVVLVAVNPAAQLARARDAGRISDVKQIANSLERYAAVNGSYPTIATDSDDAAVGCWGPWIAGTSLITNPAHKFLQPLIDSGDLKTVPTERNPISGTVPWPGWWSCSYRYAFADAGVGCKYAIIYTMLESKSSRPGGINADLRPACIAAVGWGEGSPDMQDFVIFMSAN